MSINLVESEIRRFLASDEPEVISINGHWGVGKTFAWNKFLNDAKTKNDIALERYSYVSLFGINSLDELKFAVFENTVNSSDIGVEPSIETLQSNTKAATALIGRKLIGVFKQSRYIENFIGGLPPLLFSFVKKSIVCIDDFERRGDDLKVGNILGLINTLKELRKCKVCLILNDDALGEGEKEYRKYLEKVVDTTLNFEPSPEESARIALTNDSQLGKLLTEYCVKLRISNIRVIKKIERSARQIKSLVERYDPEVLRQAVHSLTLFNWSLHEPTTAPTLDFLEKKNAVNFLDMESKKSVPSKEGTWNALLITYQFTSMDEFDAALLQGVRNGYFDASLVSRLASEMDAKIKAGNLGSAFDSAWNMYHASFDNNQDEVLSALYESFVKGVQYIAPMNMSSTVAFFKELGQEDRAAELLNYYIESRRSHPEIFDLRNNPFGEYVKDPDVRKALNQEYASLKKEKTDPVTVLCRIAETNSWNPEDIKALAVLPVEHYREMFKTTKGDDLRTIIKVCLQFGQFSDPSGDYISVAMKAKQALTAIGQESPINALRVKAYGVSIDPIPTQTTQS